MRCKFKYFISLFTIVAIVFITTPTIVNAESFSGNVSYYVQQGTTTSIQSGYQSNMSGLNISFPTQNYFTLRKQNIYYYFIKEIDISNSSFNFQNGHKYKIDLTFTFGSYVRYAVNIDGGISPSYAPVTYCGNGTCVKTSKCVTSPDNSCTWTITYDSTSTHTGLTLSLGSIYDVNQYIFWNYNSQYDQGIRLDTATITDITPTMDIAPIVNAQEQTTQAVNDNTNAINNVNNTLTDDNITADADADFFDNINLYEDNTLSGIITAPLTFLRSIDGTCQPVSLTYKGQVITLPCGDTIFWGRSDVSSFRTFWNILFGGYIIYRLCFKLFKTINDAIDPTKDNIGGVAV